MTDEITLNDNRITLKAFSARNGNHILLSREEHIIPHDIYCGGDPIRKATEVCLIELEKLRKKAIYSQCTLEELKEIKLIIETVIAEKEQPHET